MEEKKDKILSKKELQLFHEFFADSLIHPHSYPHKSHFHDRNDSKVISATIIEEESKFRKSLRKIQDIPTEIWTG